MSALDAASASDKQVVNLWDAGEGRHRHCCSRHRVEDIFRQAPIRDLVVVSLI